MEQQNLYQQFDFRHYPFEEPNSLRLDAKVRVLLCPSDTHSGSIHTSPGLGDVRFAHTNFLGSLADGPSRGMFPYRRGVRIAEVTDGTSQTLFVGERGVVFDGVNTHGWWTWGAATTIATTQPFQPGSYEDPAAIVHWWSHHPSGANFLLVDGGVHLLAYNIDDKAFAALGTRDSDDIGHL
jgi:prepilin-type processing-associated H-X9-DG protein